MGFELYHKTRQRQARKPQISLQKTGRIGINGSCLAEFFPGAQGVHLLYDPKEKLVGLKPLSEKEKDSDAYSLIRMRRSKTRFIQATGFCRYYGILPDKTHRFDPRRDTKSGLVVIDLAKPKP